MRFLALAASICAVALVTAAIFLAALYPAPALAQTQPTFRPGGAVTDTNPQPIQFRCWDGSGWLPCSQAGAASSPLVGSVTSTAATPTSGGATFAAGSATLGPLAPDLGRGLRVTLRGTWSGSFALGTSSDGCATITPLTIGGASWGNFAGNANEIVDVPTVAGLAYCATAAVTSGTLIYGVRQ